MIKIAQLLKSVVYRFYSSAITFFIAFVVTKDTFVSLTIGVIDSLIKIFSYYAFDELWIWLTGLKIAPAVVFLTGFSGAGKTTIAKSVVMHLKKKGFTPVLLDGDEIRDAIKMTGFDEESRKNHNLNVGYMAKILEGQGNIVLVSVIAPYCEVRQQIRGMCKKFIEVHVATELKVCIDRDPKGLYQRALKGEIKHFTGISAPYYPPQNPELVLDTAHMSTDVCAMKIIAHLKKGARTMERN
jgi:adenylylsulfate kinase